MNLGLEGKKAVVCASSQGVYVWVNGRDEEKLRGSAETIRKSTNNPNIFLAVGDLTTDEGRAAIVSACPDADILVNNNAGPKPGTFQDWDRDRWMGAIEGNMLAPSKSKFASSSYGYGIK